MHYETEMLISWKSEVSVFVSFLGNWGINVYKHSQHSKFTGIRFSFRNESDADKTLWFSELGPDSASVEFCLSHHGRKRWVLRNWRCLLTICFRIRIKLKWRSEFNTWTMSIQTETDRVLYFIYILYTDLGTVHREISFFNPLFSAFTIYLLLLMSSLMLFCCPSIVIMQISPLFILSYISPRTRWQQKRRRNLIGPLGCVPGSDWPTVRTL